MGAGGSGTYTDFVVEPNLKQGSWYVGQGAIHHMAYNCPDSETQNKIKFFVGGSRLHRFSDVKDRGYFDSIYVRTPSGALLRRRCLMTPHSCVTSLMSLGHSSNDVSTD